MPPSAVTQAGRLRVPKRIPEKGDNASGELGLLPPPLWGRAGEGGGAVKHRHCPTHNDPHPQPLPTRGRGAHRVRGTAEHQARSTARFSLARMGQAPSAPVQTRSASASERGLTKRSSRPPWACSLRQSLAAKSMTARPDVGSPSL